MQPVAAFKAQLNYTL